MMATVSIITYNHEKYIAQAIESVLMQRTDFDFEIIVGEDDSTDGTREIVQRFKERYPERIRLLLNDRKDVIFINGRPTGRWNFINNLRHARGKYVALLEGDDYWTSPDKLQKQADYLEANPDCAICFHSAWCEDDGGRRLRMLFPRHRKPRYVLKDLLRENLIPNCSVVFRNGLFGEFPDWFYGVPMGDLPLHVLNAQHGDLGYLDEAMAVYRIHGGGVWSTQRRLIQLNSRIAALKALGGHLGRSHSGVIRTAIFRCRFQIFEKRAGLLLRRLGLGRVVNLYRRIFYPAAPRVPEGGYRAVLEEEQE